MSCTSVPSGQKTTKDRRGKWLTAAVVLAGIVLRVIYCLGTTIFERQYDAGTIALDAGHRVSGGHLAYIQYLYENGRLPDFNPTTVYQFHHPPLFHAAAALWMRFMSLFVHDTVQLEESIQMVPLACAVITLLVCVQLFRLLPMEERGVCFAAAILAFHPTLIQFSGSVNNDCMGLMFTVLILYQAMRWSRRPSAGRILLLAVWFGLGVSTKQNVAEMAVPVGAVFARTFFHHKNQNADHGLDAARRRQLALQYALFLAVGLPLSLWFYVRNLVRWHVPLLWVYTLPDDSWQYVGGVPLVNRFLWPVPSEFLGNLRHFTIGCGYNVWLEIIRTSMLGEWDMADVGRPVKILAVLLMLAGALLGLLCTIDLGVVCLGRYGREKRSFSPEDRLLLGFTWLITMVCYLKFVYDYPQQCSMNFRYIAVALVPTAAAAGLCMSPDMAPDAGTRGQNCQSRPFQALWRGAHRFLLVLFCLLSAGMIAVWAA